MMLQVSGKECLLHCEYVLPKTTCLGSIDLQVQQCHSKKHDECQLKSVMEWLRIVVGCVMLQHISLETLMQKLAAGLKLIRRNWTLWIKDG